MKLYLKIDQPGGKRVRVMDIKTKKKLFEAFLYPSKPVEVAPPWAAKLIEQNPHLVDEKPFQEIKEVDAESYKPVLAELSKITLDELKSADIIKYGKKVGIEIPMSMPRTKKIAFLDKRIHELAKGLIN